MVFQKGFFGRTILFIMINAILLSSCAKRIDISENEILCGDYKQGMVLMAKRDMVLTNENILWEHEPVVRIVKKGGRKNEYRGILEPGTKLVIVRIEMYSHIEVGRYVYPIAKILNGIWDGEEVNLYLVSKILDSPYGDSYYINILGVDPDLFEIVQGNFNDLVAE